MSSPLVIDLTVSTPPVVGQPDCPFPFQFATLYQHLVKYRFTWDGSGTQVIDFGSLTALTLGVKALLFTVDKDTSLAFQKPKLVINDGTDEWQVDQGGFLAYGNTEPDEQGILSMSITHPSAAKAYLWLFG
jgi:hypothetical protein